MREITVTIRPDRSVEVDIELPPGDACEATDEVLRAMLALLGARIEETSEGTGAPRIPNGVPQRGRTSGG